MRSPTAARSTKKIAEKSDRQEKLGEKFDRQDELNDATAELKKLNDALGLEKPENKNMDEGEGGDDSKEAPEEDEDDGGSTMEFHGVADHLQPDRGHCTPRAPCAGQC